MKRWFGVAACGAVLAAIMYLAQAAPVIGFVSTAGNTSSGEPVTPPEDPVPFGSYYVDEANGNDANDGVLVAEGGTGPWQTLDRALDAATAGDFDLVAASDDIHVVFRNTGDGIYDVTGHVLEGGGATCLGRYIRFRTHPDDAPVTFATDEGNEQATGIINMGSSNYSFERMYWIADEQFIGSNGGASPAQTGLCWRFVDITQLWSGTSYSVDNHGIIMFNNDGGGEFDGAEIIRSSFEGNDSPHANGATFYFEDVNSSISFRDVIISNQGNGQTLYFKHPPALDPGAGNNVTFENCVIRHEANARGLISFGPNRVEYENCLLLWETVDERALHVTSAVDNAGYASGHANLFNHVTFWSGSNHADGGFWAVSDQHSGALSGTANSITNSVFINSLPAIGSTVPYTHSTTLDYNLYQVTGNAAMEFNVGYSTLALWVTAYGQDSNSVEEDANLLGTADPDDYTSFELDPASLGFGAASDNENMGFYDTSWLSAVGAAN